MNHITPSSALLLMLAASSPLAAQGGECRPIETRPPNGVDQQPAFRGQTRICAVTSGAKYEVTVVAKGLANPWSVEPLSGGDILVTERPGRMRIVSAEGRISEPIAGLPDVVARGQGGLLDAALSPSFAADHTVFWSFSEPREGGNATSVARGVLSGDRTRLTEVKVIFRALPAYDGGAHFGSRLAFGPDGMLYITLGERSDNQMRPQAQQLDSHMGKIIRIAPDGSVPQDNPFVGKAGALPEIWDLGHRNPQALAFDAKGQLWDIEHGTRGGDELNRVEKGKNYGWPIQAYGIEYGGAGIHSALGDAATTRPNTEQPTYYWDPVIAPSGAQFYSGDAFPAWKGSLFIGSMGQMRLVRLTLANNKVTGEEHLLTDRRARIRDVRQGPDGFLYVVTDAANGELWRIAPAR
jgi:glucose/arabinose dehydrogenase